MARKKSSKKKDDKAVVFEIRLIFLSLISVVLLLSVHGFALGLVGEFIKDFLSGLFSVSVYLIPYFFIAALAIRYVKKLNEFAKRYYASLVVLFFAQLLFVGISTNKNGMSAVFNLFSIGEIYSAGQKFQNAGVIGNLFFAPLHAILGNIGVILLIIALSLVFLTLVSKLTFSKIMKFFGKAAKTTGDKAIEGGKKIGDAISVGMEKIQDDRQENEYRYIEDKDVQESDHIIDAFIKPKKDKAKEIDSLSFSDEEKPIYSETDFNVQPEGFVRLDEEVNYKPEQGGGFEFIEIPADRFDGKIQKNDEDPIEGLGDEKPFIEEPKNEPKTYRVEDVDEEDSEDEDIDLIEDEEEFKGYEVPPVSILLKGKSGSDVSGKKDIKEKYMILEETFKSFKVDAKVVSAERGPMVTRFEVKPMPGVKISKIASLNHDIAMRLAATNVRILAPIPGKAAVGIEVPNESVSVVRLRDVIESDEYNKEDSLIKFALGKDISGKNVVADLSKMPHLLIAGATGSGKSVCVNTIISSILFNAKPDEVKFLMIDPKVVELNIYNGIPHLLLPVVTDASKASIALGWAVNEMNKRYTLFAEHKVRDINSFNSKREENPEMDVEFMPRIVIIIDELADLMMVAKNQVEESIARIAQMARAAGMHLIVATQRPSVDVITGLIKANIPSRIAFSVSSHIDSRTIIDEQGAEKLLGKGDMLFLNAGKSKPTRVQGAFITDTEVEALVSFVKNQLDKEPDYDEEVLDIKNIQALDMSSADDSDALMDAAIEFVIRSEKASTSMVQRKFKIGYNRAARLVEAMEERGIVGPSRGSKPREVLVGTSYLSNYDIANPPDEGEVAE